MQLRNEKETKAKRQRKQPLNNNNSVKVSTKYDAFLNYLVTINLILSTATDDDIQLYFNERKSRLDPVHQETRLDPIPQTDQKYENESKEEPIPVEDDNTSPLSTARTNLQQQQQQTQTTTATTRPLSPALSTTDDQHSVITTASDQSRFDQPEQIGDDPSTEDRREKRKRRKKIKQSLIQTPQDESTLLARELSNDTTNGQQPLIQEDTIDHEERAPSPVTRRQLPGLCIYIL